MTRAGMGVAVMSAWIAGPHLQSGELVTRRLKKGALQRPWRIAYRREHEAAVKLLMPMLQAACPRQIAQSTPRLRPVRAQNG